MAAGRQPLDLRFNPRRASEQLVSQYCGSFLATAFDHSEKGFPDAPSVTFADKRSSRRRKSFHGGELDRGTDGKWKTSASASVVGLGCWVPSHNMKAGTQTSNSSSQEPSLPMAGGHDFSSKTNCLMQSKAELCPQQFSAGFIERSGSNSPVMYVCPVPDPSSINKPNFDAFRNSSAHQKSTQHCMNDKSRRRRQQGVRDVQVAIHRLSSKLKRMDLDEVLLPATWQGLAAENCDDDTFCMAHEEKIQDVGSLNSDQEYNAQKEVDVNHGGGFPARRSGRVHSRHKAHRKKRDHGPSNHLHSQYKETSERESRVQNADSVSEVYPAEEEIQTPENGKAETPHYAECLEKENSADVALIELDIISRPRKEASITDPSAVEEVQNGLSAVLTSRLTPKPLTAEGSSSDHQDEVPESNMAKGLCFTGMQALEPVANNLQDATLGSPSICHLDAAGSLPSDHHCIGEKSPCFAELLLSSSDAVSSNSESSYQLSEALQNLSGGQGRKDINTEESLTMAKQGREQFSQKYDMKEKVCCKSHALLASSSCINRSGSFSTASARERVFLWINEQDKAFRGGAADMDVTLVLKRFGNLLLSSLSSKGMHAEDLEPLFYETIKIARAFLRVFSSHIFELSKDRFTCEYLDGQRDRKVSLVSMAPLPNTLFVHENHIKFGVQALINEVIFDHFDKPSYCGSIRDVESWVLLVEFQRFCTCTPIDAINPVSGSYDKYFHSLCSQKLQLVKNKFPWLVEWMDHLVEAFLEAMKYVWQAHLIARVSANAICFLQIKEWSPYDSSIMDVVDYDHDAVAFIGRVQFVASSGFKLQCSVVKSEVYLIPKTQ